MGLFWKVVSVKKEGYPLKIVKVKNFFLENFGMWNLFSIFVI